LGVSKKTRASTSCTHFIWAGWKSDEEFYEKKKGEKGKGEYAKRKEGSTKGGGLKRREKEEGGSVERKRAKT